MLIQPVRTLNLTALLLWAMHAIAGGAAQQSLEQHLQPDERERIHLDLDDYSSKVYPDNLQLEERRQKMRDRLKQADSEANVPITREEAEQRMPGLAQHFDEVDLDGNGLIEHAELMAASEKLRESRQQQVKRDMERRAAPGKKPPKRRPKPATDTEAEGA